MEKLPVFSLNKIKSPALPQNSFKFRDKPPIKPTTAP